MSDITVTVNARQLQALLRQLQAASAALTQTMLAAQASQVPVVAAVRHAPRINPQIQMNPVAQAAYYHAMKALGQSPKAPSGFTGAVATTMHAKLLGPMIAIWVGTEQARRLLRGVLGIQRGETSIEDVVRRLVKMSIPEMFREIRDLVHAMAKEDVRRAINDERVRIQAEYDARDLSARLRDSPSLQESAAMQIERRVREANRVAKASAPVREEWLGL